MASIKERIRKAREQGSPQDDEQTWGETALGVARSATEGLTFGWGDEIGTGIAATAAALQDPDKSFGEIYGEMRNVYARQQGEFREQNPALATGAEIAGGLAGGMGAAARAPQALTRIPGILRYPGAGATAGGVTGAGFAEEGERAEGAGTGAAVGGITGAAVPAIGSFLRPAANRFVNRMNPRQSAAREIADAVEADEMTPESVQRRLIRMGGEQVDESGRSPVNIADAGGYNVLGTARAAQSVPGRGKNTIRTALEQRDKGQIGRMSRALDETMEAPGSYRETLEQVEQNLRTKARPFYQKAYQQQVSDETFEELGQDEVIQDALSRIQSKAANRRALQGVTPKSLKTLDLVKRNLDDAYEEARRQGRNNEAREILDAKQELVRKLDEVSPDYQQARQIYGGEAQKREAMELGERILKDPEDVSEDVLKGLSEGDRAFFRQGAKRAILQKMEQAGYSHDVVKRIFNSPKVRKRLQQAFPSTKAYRQFQREALRESRKRLTKDQVLGGSPTQRIKAEQQASGEAAEAAEAGGELAMGSPYGLVRAAARSIFAPDSSVDPRQAEYVSRMLMTRSPQEQQQVLQMLRQRPGLLSGERPLGTGVGALGAPAAVGGLLGPER